MGYDTINKMASFKVTPEGETEAIYAFFTLIGDSNCYDENNKMSQRWHCMLLGSKWSVMANLVSLSSGFESGMLKHKNRDSLPETMIKNFRKTINASVEVSDLRNCIPSFNTVQLWVSDSEEALFDSEKKKVLSPYKRASQYGGVVFEWDLSPEGIKAYFETSYHLNDSRILSYYNTVPVSS